MCGIAGGLHTEMDRAQAEQMLQSLKHRGPDDSGVFWEDRCWLGNTRLAIQDLSKSGHQPMQSPDGRFILVFNGEIYNHLKIRKELIALHYNFQSHCDTETLLHAWACWGKACLDKLEGDFAFAILDKERNSLFLVRDRMGVKPLYYYQKGKILLFASEIKAFVPLNNLDKSLNNQAFFSYLLFQYNPGNDTPFQYIRKLPPSHYLEVKLDSGAPQLHSWYKIPLSGKYENHSTDEWIRLLDNALNDVIRSQMHADVSVGLTLSGGLDSSLIAAMARKQYPDQEIHAFSINTQGQMKGEGFEDDYPFAKLVAQQYGLTLQSIDGNLDLEHDLDKLIWELDEPQADPASLNMAHIAQAANKMGIKVLLSGTGGDDVFSGYRRHQALRFLRFGSQLPAMAGPLVQQLASLSPGSARLRRASKLFSLAGKDMDRSLVELHFWNTPARVRQLFQSGLLGTEIEELPFRQFQQLLEEIPAEKNLLNQALFLEQRSFLPQHNLAYMDKLGMASSVEVRVPYVDERIVALAAGMPPQLKYSSGQSKWILRKVAAAYLPIEIINRPKTGFGAPLRQWMQGSLKDLVRERVLDPSFTGRGIFDAKSLEALIQDNQSGKIDAAYTLFSLMSIESWLRQFAMLS